MSSVNISIITPVFNAGQTLERMLTSIFYQTYTHWELIIVDGGSTDETVDIIAKYRDKISHYIVGKDKGIYDAMNKGLALATGEYVTFLNADDYYFHRTILDVVFRDNVCSDLIYGDIFVDENKSKPIRYQKALDFSKDNLLQHGTAVVCHQAIFVKRDISPAYSLKYRYKSELNWYFDMLEKNTSLSISHKKIPVVVYSFGGAGYNHYVRNLIEWAVLVLTRFGPVVFFRYHYPKMLLTKLQYRYHFRIIYPLYKLFR